MKGWFVDLHARSSAVGHTSSTRFWSTRTVVHNRSRSGQEERRMRACSARGFGVVGLLIGLLLVAAAVAVYFWLALSWSYAAGERAGWVQKFSRKGWICKTWEGEMAMVSMPGSTTEKFAFTVRDDAVSRDINRLMGRRVTLHYEQKVGLPTTCFGETRYYVNGVTAVEEIPLAPGVVVPTPSNPSPK